MSEKKNKLAGLLVTTLGVVYGDIGTRSAFPKFESYHAALSSL